MKDKNDDPIPLDIARKLCEEIRTQKSHRLFTQCWGCVKASKGEFSRMCVSSRQDLRGCGLVNSQYDRRKKQPP